MNMDTEKITFINEEGGEETFYVQAETTLGGVSYLLVTETEDLSGDAYIFEQTEETEDELTFDVVDDDDQLEALGAVFEALLSEEDGE